MAAKKKFNPTVGGWKYNRKGTCPVDPDVLVQVRQRDGSFETGRAGNQFWEKEGSLDVIWWRKARKPKAEPKTITSRLVVGTNPKKLAGVWKVTGAIREHNGRGGKTTTAYEIECLTTAGDRLHTTVRPGAIREATLKELREHGFAEARRPKCVVAEPAPKQCPACLVFYSKSRESCPECGATDGHAPYKFEVGQVVRITDPKFIDVPGRLMRVTDRINLMIGQGNIYRLRSLEGDEPMLAEKLGGWTQLPERALEEAEAPPRIDGRGMVENFNEAERLAANIDAMAAALAEHSHTGGVTGTTTSAVLDPVRATRFNVGDPVCVTAWGDLGVIVEIMPGPTDGSAPNQYGIRLSFKETVVLDEDELALVEPGLTVTAGTVTMADRALDVLIAILIVVVVSAAFYFF